MESARAHIANSLTEILKQKADILTTNPHRDVSAIGRRIERGMFNHTIESSHKNNFARNWEDETFRETYRARYVAIRLNIQRAETKLAERVLKGDVAPEAVGEYMTVAEMYPELMAKDKQTKDDIIKSSIIPAVSPSLGISTILKCYRCLRSGGDAYKVTYHMQQTRRADEATTVFAHCTSCGARWRTY